MKSFRTIVSEFSKFMLECEAVSRRDPILKTRLHEIAKQIMRECDRKHPYEIDHQRSIAIMETFIERATHCMTARARELEHANRGAA